MKAILILTVAIFILLSLPFSAQSQTPITAVPQGGPIMGLIPIAVNPSTGYSQPAAVFANNLNTYFVAYRSSLNEIILTSVAPSGALLNSFALASAREFYDRSAPDLDYDPDHTQALVVWEAIDPSDGYRDIRGRIFAGGSSTFDFSICEGALGAQCFHPAVAYSRVQSRYLVVWQRTSGPEASGDIEGQFIYWDGNPQGTFTIRTSAGADSFAQPDVAFNHRRNEFLVAFQLVDCSEFPCQTDILGHRVNSLGEVLDQSFGIKIGYNTVPERDPAVAAYPDPFPDLPLSKCWMIAWTMQYAPDPLDRDIHHNLLNCDGVPQGGTGWALAATNLDDYDPSIAWSESAQKYLVTWTLTTFVFPNSSSIIGMEINTSGDPASKPRLIGGWFGTHSTIAAGQKGDFLVAYTESVPFFPQQVLGFLWGNRVYIPAVRK